MKLLTAAVYAAPRAALRTRLRLWHDYGRPVTVTVRVMVGGGGVGPAAARDSGDGGGDAQGCARDLGQCHRAIAARAGGARGGRTGAPGDGDLRLGDGSLSRGTNADGDLGRPGA